MTDPNESPASAGLLARPWIIAESLVGEPYPCRCHERLGKTCSPLWCPCAGRVDYENVQPGCCAPRNTPDRVTQARAVYDLKKRREAMGG